MNYGTLFFTYCKKAVFVLVMQVKSSSNTFTSGAQWCIG